MDGYHSWKLERRQDFQEPGDGSWVAFMRGDWAEALRLVEAERDSLRKLSRTAAEHRCRLLRERVVEQPVSAHPQWELHQLRVRAECGELIRVVGPERVAAFSEELHELGEDISSFFGREAAGSEPPPAP